MKKAIILLAALLIAVAADAQVLQDVVYLLNGSVVRGTLIEQVPNVKIRTTDGSLWVFKQDEIDKITSEPAVQQPQQVDVNVNDNAAQRVESTRNRWARQTTYYDLTNGLRIIADISVMVQTSYYTCSAISYSGSFGHQFSPNVYAGLGVAAQVYLDYWYYTKRGDEAELYAQMPLFAELRYDVKPTKFSPFASMRAGYAVGLDEYNDHSGLYLNPSVGVRYKALSFSVGADLVKLKDPWHFVELLANKQFRYTDINWQSSVMFKIAYEWGGRRRH